MCSQKTSNIYHFDTWLKSSGFSIDLNILPPIKDSQDSDDLSKALLALIDLAESAPKMFKPLFQNLVQIDGLVEFLVKEAGRGQGSHFAHGKVVGAHVELREGLGQAVVIDALGPLRLARMLSTFHQNALHGWR